MSSLSHSYSSVCQTSGPKSVAFRVVFLSVAWPGPPCAALSGKASASDPYVSFFTRSWQGRGRRGGTQGLAWKAGASAADHAAPTRPRRGRLCRAVPFSCCPFVRMLLLHEKSFSLFLELSSGVIRGSASCALSGSPATRMLGRHSPSSPCCSVH